MNNLKIIGPFIDRFSATVSVAQRRRKEATDRWFKLLKKGVIGQHMEVRQYEYRSRAYSAEDDRRFR